mmetsp:Transcript_62763/g.147178  ORF Transcript_62763/g.147178 Transcript_62763/m.147178 type:complete len:265 (+) Transcript_62763:352-1146(+)
MMKPWDPPEKRPSVIRATCFPRPAPMIALVGVSISRIPGPPFGPSYRITMKSPLEILPCSSPFSIASSLSKTLALPVKDVPSLPVILATAPSVQRFPRKILMLPVFWTHLSKGSITLCAPKSRSGTLARFWAIVWPVIVRQSPCSQPSFNRYFITAGMPPTRCTSSILYLPLGFKSATSAVLSLILWKSSMDSSIPAVAAMASKCSTALVEPPSAFTSTMAFSKDFFVRMSIGFRFRSSMAFTHWAARWHSARFSGEVAGEELE